MSNRACETYGIDIRLFNRACPGEYYADVEAYGRIYIGGLQQLVSTLDGEIRTLKITTEMLTQRLKDKDEMIALLRSSTVLATPSSPRMQRLATNLQPMC